VASSPALAGRNSLRHPAQLLTPTAPGVSLLWFFRSSLGWGVCNGIILAASLLIVNWFDWSVHGPDVDSLWSPYYHLQHEHKSGWVRANGMQHQVMSDRAQACT